VQSVAAALEALRQASRLPQTAKSAGVRSKTVGDMCLDDRNFFIPGRNPEPVRS
jgi:hypothetical protein